jgi:hypothetical protein
MLWFLALKRWGLFPRLSSYLEKLVLFEDHSDNQDWEES